MTPNELTQQEYLRELALQLDQAERYSARLYHIDDPEGVRTIRMSDTLAREIAERLRRIAECL